MIEFYYPELLLIGIPLAFLFWRYTRTGRATTWLRAGILWLLLLAIAGPLYNLGGQGIDVIVVADRSRSLSPQAEANIRELINNLDHNRGRGDRVGLVTFGAEPQIERLPSETALFEGYSKPINVDGSDLNTALQVAINLSDENRPTRILMLTDGEANGVAPTLAARQAREANIPLDYRIFDRVRVGDVAVESLHLPEEISPRTPFQFSVYVHADRVAEGTLIVRRNGEVIASSERQFSIGRNRILFRDLVDRPGFMNYEAELIVPGDPVLENNRGQAGLRVDAGPRVLVLNHDGQAGNLIQALQAGRIPVDVAEANTFPLSQDTLDPYRVLILENVPANSLGRQKMEAIAQYVEDLGNGLLVTGGQRSFGVGGYFNSPLDPVLPVSMELREEHRKSRVAISVVLDRSGSMMAPVAGGKTKMDLANLGTAECIRLLSAGDSISVLAVDTVPHVIVPQTNLRDPEPLVRQVLGIQSMGGGIYVYEGLVAAGKELVKAEQQTKHIILFSDAQDSEEPGDYKRLLDQFSRSGITVSVIGLGTTRDVDAKLLEDIAARGSGSCVFTEDASELPRLFSEDTMSVARSSFVEKDPETQPDGIPALQVPDSRLIGDWGTAPFPPIDGYNLSYLKPEATLGVVSQDEYQAPLSAFWYRGLGRVAALSVEVDGKYSGSFTNWESYPDFLITHTRWLLGNHSSGEVFVTLQREGQDAIATVELDPQRPDRGGVEIPELIVVAPGLDRQETLTPVFNWTGPDTLQARFRMNQLGTYRTLLKTSEQQFTRGPTISLPYSPEFAPRLGLPTGPETLAELAKLSGGTQLTNVLEVFREAPRSPKKQSLSPWLLGGALLLILLEIAGRRLALWDSLTRGARRQSTSAPSPATAGPQPRPITRPYPASGKTPASAPLTAQQPPPPPEKAEDKPADKPKVDIFAQAKNRAKRRT